MYRISKVLSVGALLGLGACALGDDLSEDTDALALPSPGPVETVAEFDPASGELPENLAVDARNQIAVSFIQLAAVHRVKGDGTHAALAALGPDLLTVGLTAGPGSRLYVLSASPTGDPAANAVWEIDADGQASLYATLPGSALPNDLAVDRSGDLYVTDSILGAIWRIDTGGNAELWLVDPLLAGVTPPLDYPGHPPFPIGANGIVVTPRVVYVANTDRNAVVMIRRQPDGAPIAAELLARGPAPGDFAGCAANPGLVCAPDGLALDVLHNVYAAGVGSSTVVRVTPDGSSELIAGLEDGLDSPSDCAFGGDGDRAALYCSNYAVISASMPGAAARPSVTRQDIGVPGYPGW